MAKMNGESIERVICLLFSLNYFLRLELQNPHLRPDIRDFYVELHNNITRTILALRRLR